MKRLDEDFLNELEGRIDETFKETQTDQRGVTGDHGDTMAGENDISNPGAPQGIHGDVAGGNEAETMVFDLTDEEVSAEKKQSGSPGPGQPKSAETSSRPYHPMEISTNLIVTGEDVEFAVKKFVKDLKECLRFSKAISVRFDIKTVDEG